MTYYHVTDRRNRDSIREHGLDPEHSDTWRGTGYPHVWAWDDEHYQRALDWGAGAKRPMDIWHLDPAGLEWVPDPHAADPDDGMYRGGCATSKVPPENLVRVEEYVGGGTPWWERAKEEAA